MATMGKPGTQIGMLTVVKPLPKIKGSAYSLMRCECGTEKPVARSNLIKAAREGAMISCGCYQRARLELFAQERADMQAARHVLAQKHAAVMLAYQELQNKAIEARIARLAAQQAAIDERMTAAKYEDAQPKSTIIPGQVDELTLRLKAIGAPFRPGY